MPREIQDSDGIRWTCVQAYAGVGGSAAAEDAARVEGTDRVRVVCTPSGGSRTVELELAADWEESLDDDALMERIRARQR